MQQIQEILAEYGDIVAKYFDVDALQFIESTSGPGIVMLDGAIVATVERYENYENDNTELYYNYDIRDTQETSYDWVAGMPLIKTVTF